MQSSAVTISSVTKINRFRSALVGTSTLIPVLASLFTMALYIGLPKADTSGLAAIAGGGSSDTYSLGVYGDAIYGLHNRKRCRCV